MQKRDLLRIYLDRDGKPVSKVSDMQMAAVAAAGLAEKAIAKGDFSPLNMLVAIIGQILADDSSGSLEKQFQHNLQRITTAIRERKQQKNPPQNRN